MVSHPKRELVIHVLVASDSQEQKLPKQSQKTMHKYKAKSIPKVNLA